jgi:hypothetical protein
MPAPSPANVGDAAAVGTASAAGALAETEAELNASIDAQLRHAAAVTEQLEQVQLQVRLAAGPTRLALEHIRHKVEASGARLDVLRCGPRGAAAVLRFC